MRPDCPAPRSHRTLLSAIYIWYFQRVKIHHILIFVRISSCKVNDVSYPGHWHLDLALTAAHMHSLHGCPIRWNYLIYQARTIAFLLAKNRKKGIINAFPTWYKATQSLLLTTYLRVTANMIHFTTFFALVVGGMEVIQPAAAGVLAGLSPRLNLGLMNTFQRRQGSAPPPPPQCANTCAPIANIISNVSGAIFRY